MKYSDSIKRLAKEGYVVPYYLKDILKLLDKGEKLDIRIPRKNGKILIYKK